LRTEFSTPVVISASTLSGDRVQTPEGENLGKIEELMIDLDSGRVAYAVLSFGGILGMGNKLFAYPFEALTVDTMNKVIILNINKEVLENAPGLYKYH
jgi:sporulation protein YlmC with PRC-barrel domain